MMPKRKWAVMLAIFVCYLFLGATFFYKIENTQELETRKKEREEQIEIQETLINYIPNNERFMYKLSEFCGKSLYNKTDKQYELPPKWDFYHAVFFSFTVVTTVGYGNLAPTTIISRTFMVIYGIIAIPFNGIMFAALGDYFGRTFLNLYRKWKNSKVKGYAASLGLISQIILYLIPGFVIFIFLPAIVIMHFEQWDYALSVYYAFVTLTTIGFGDFVAGMINHGFEEVYFKLYQVFLLVWIVFGLGYLVMVLGFITRGMRSKKIKHLEKQLSHNIKTTHHRIWNGFIKDISFLRRIVNEVHMQKFKPVYRDEISCATTPRIGNYSQSFPDLRVLLSTRETSPTISRRRAFSESIEKVITRVQSDTDLERIDKEATFARASISQPVEFLANITNALASCPYDEDDEEFSEDLGVHGFSDLEILASEVTGSDWTLGSDKIPAQPPKVPRIRAASEVKIPTTFKQENFGDWTWYGPAATKKIQELRERVKQSRKFSEPISSKPTFLERLKNTITKTRTKQPDVENQQPNHSEQLVDPEDYLAATQVGRASVFSVPESRILEETSVADLLRALNLLHTRVAAAQDAPKPKRKFGTASLTPPKSESIPDVFNAGAVRYPTIRSALRPRRTSSALSATNPVTRRRFSLHPVSEDQLLSPPPSYRQATLRQTPGEERRGSLFLAAQNPVPKQISRLRNIQNRRLLYVRTRHDSLKDINIDS